MKPRFIFLDFGGTLAEQVNSREEAMAASFKLLGLSVAPAQITAPLKVARERWEPCWRPDMTAAQRWEYFTGLYQQVAEGLGFAANSRELGEHLWATQDDTYQLFPDVQPALRSLRQSGARLGIISNWDKADLGDTCRDLGIADWFDVILASAEAGADKPLPQVFHRALELAGESAAACAHVGDSYEADVQGARAVGVTGILLLRRAVNAAFDCPTVHSLEEVGEVLAAL